MLHSRHGAAVCGPRGAKPMMAMAWARVWGTSLLAWCLGVALQLQQTVLWPAFIYGAGLMVACVGAWALRRLALGHRAAVLAWGLSMFSNEAI